MILFPNCKINLGLRLIQKRADGYHDLETIFYPIALQDALEVVQHPAPFTDIEFGATGLAVDGNLSDNSCVKAYHLLKAHFPQLPPVKMHLHKTIPLGAGLGGGSADGAFALVLLNKKFNLGISDEMLMQYALQLGSDCPFFIKNIPCLATGRGEVLEPIAVDLSAYFIVLVNPGVHINTGWAFSQIVPSANGPALKQVIQQPVEEWKTYLKNDFEDAVFPYHPELNDIKNALYKSGALYASMTGSGSTVFGIFGREVIPQLSFPEPYFVKTI